MFRSTIKLMLDVQPRIGEDVKGIENIFCLLSKVNESGESTSSKDFIFGAQVTQSSEPCASSFDPSSIHIFFVYDHEESLPLPNLKFCTRRNGDLFVVLSLFFATKKS